MCVRVCMCARRKSTPILPTSLLTICVLDSCARRIRTCPDTQLILKDYLRELEERSAATIHGACTEMETVLERAAHRIFEEELQVVATPAPDALSPTIDDVWATCSTN